MTTFVGHFLGPNVHSARPAPETVAEGTLYVCTTHNKIERTLAGVWTDWTAMGGISGDMTELGYQQRVTNVDVPSSSSYSTLLTNNPITLDGSTRIRIEGFVPWVQVPPVASMGCYNWLFDDTTALGIVSTLATPAAATYFSTSVHWVVYLTPAAGVHTYIWKAIKTVSTAGTINFITGSIPGGYAPIFMRVSRA